MKLSCALFLLGSLAFAVADSPVCWPAESCTACTACCKPYLTTEASCSACVSASCNASNFTGVKIITTSDVCDHTQKCQNCACCNANWGNPNIQLVLNAEGNSSAGLGASLFGVNSVLDLTADPTTGMVLQRFLLNATNSVACPSSPRMSLLTIEASMAKTGQMNFTMDFEDQSPGYPCMPVVTQNLGPPEHPTLLVSFVSNPN